MTTTALRPPAGAPDAPTAPASPRRTARAWDVVLVVVTALQAAALLGAERVVTVDGPAHLASAAALLQAGDGVHRLYEVTLLPLAPNALATVLLAALLPLAGPDGAERLLVLGYALGLPLALRAALRAVDPRAGWLALAGVPLAGGYLSSYGFYGLLLGVVGMLLVAAVALRQRTGWTGRAVVGATALLLLTWTAHLLPLLVAGLLVAVLAACRATAARRLGTPTAVALRTHVLPAALTGLPVLALTAVFVATSDDRGAPVRTSTVPELLGGLLDLGRPLVTWTPAEYAGSSLVAAGLLAVALTAARRWPRTPERVALAVTGLLVVAWYLATPDRYGQAYGLLHDRLALLAPLLLVLWAASPPPSWRTARTAVAGGALVAVGTVALLGARLPTQLQHQRDVAELVSVAGAVSVGSTIVTLRVVRTGPVGDDARNRARDPLRHQAGRVAVLRDGVDVGHYQAATDYFPVRFAPPTDPRAALDPTGTGPDQVPPQVDLTRGPDVVLLVGRTRATAAGLAEAAPLLAQVEASYRRVAVSSATGLVEVWVRR